MRPNQIEDDEEEEFRGPSKSHLKRVQNELQELGRVMTKSSNTAVCVISVLSVVSFS